MNADWEPLPSCPELRVNTDADKMTGNNTHGVVEDMLAPLYESLGDAALGRDTLKSPSPSRCKRPTLTLMARFDRPATQRIALDAYPDECRARARHRA